METAVAAVGAYFDERAGSWDVDSDRPGIKHMVIAHIAGVANGSRVLDIGCGTGVMEPALVACGAGKIVALDLSQSMLDIARQKYPSMPVEFIQADIVEYADSSVPGAFDSAVIYNAYPHFLDKPALIEAVCRLLVPGGRFLVAHGAGRDVINAHHRTVPAHVSRELGAAEVESALWSGAFDIDMIVDAPHFYCFGGPRK